MYLNTYCILGNFSVIKVWQIVSRSTEAPLIMLFYTMLKQYIKIKYRCAYCYSLILSSSSLMIWPRFTKLSLRQNFLMYGTQFAGGLQLILNHVDDTKNLCWNY